MKWFSNCPMSTKLAIIFGFFIVIIALLISQSITSLFLLSKTSHEVFKKDLNAAIITKIDDNNSQIQIALSNLLLNHGNKQMLIDNQIKKAVTEEERSMLELSENNKDDERFNLDYTVLKNMHNDVVRILETQIYPLILEDKLDDARKIIFLLQDDHFRKMSDMADKMVLEASKSTASAIKSTDNIIKTSIIYFIISGLIAVIFAIIMIVLMNNTVAKPLKDITLAARKIGRGELKIKHISNESRKDEVGVLHDSFIHMSNWLQSVAIIAKDISKGDLTAQVTLQSEEDVLGKSLQTMIKKLNQLTEEISEAILFLSTASNEIASATHQLSSSAAETATSISETTTTIEEVKQTSQMANKKAKHVSDTAKKTSDLSEEGKNATHDMSNVIAEIHKQMSLIADTMVRLNEQSQAVGTIISTVEDLAHQTNLLAVNASIEASKAGEQGKGFSVVAQEVKLLANQSKQATSQVKIILNDIQKAASEAVMATELGSKAVELGVKKTSAASESIIHLAQMITEASQAASQITAVSSQQLVGMEQASIAMENIKSASSQNVESAKSLKESVTSMQKLGGRLKQLIGQFKLRDKKNTDEG